MAAEFTDQEINKLVVEKKLLPEDYQSRTILKARRGHSERELDLTGENKSDFRLILRQSLFNPVDFSVILAYRPPKSNTLFRLRRYNGKSHEHTNQIEGITFYDYHIHQATERYQDIGAREDAYAEQTNRYSNFQEAVKCMLEDCGFKMPFNPQANLFGGFE
jgi:hypothetical protein